MVIKRSRGWTMTANNPMKLAQSLDRDSFWLCEAQIKLRNLEKDGTLAHYVCGFEHFYEEYKTPHLQVAMYFNEKISFTQLRKLFPQCHLDPLTYPYQLAVDYCKKGGIFEEEGVLSKALLYYRIDTYGG